ncbi:MAG: rhomboid family intramembrane serine protease [Planctomycetota bacterium]
MLIVVPYKTDAAVEHRPWGTIGLLVANVAVVLFLGFPEPVYESFWGPVEEPFVNSLVLELGSFNPLTWITCSFVHGGWIHLVVNMIFLWIFGLIVEGLIGWRRFLPIYLGIAAVASGILQIVMLGAEGGWVAGSSDAIFGLMAIAALWAPRNHTTVWFWIITIVSTGEITVLTLCYFWLGLNLLFAALTGFALSSYTIHLLGALIGLVVGYFMLRWNQVDCGGWDFLSLRAGRPVPLMGDRAAESPATPEAPRDPRVAALVRVRDALAANDGAAANAAFGAGQAAAPGWLLPRSDLLKLIAALRTPDQAERARARMEEFLQAYPERSEAVRLALIQSLLQANRPARAREHLAALEAGNLNDAQRAAKAQLEAQARETQGRAGLELE